MGKRKKVIHICSNCKRKIKTAPQTIGTLNGQTLKEIKCPKCGNVMRV